MKKILLMVLFIAPVSLFAQKFGHFNSAELIQLMPDYKTAQTELENLQKQYEDEIKNMQDEFNRKYEDYTKQQDSLPANIRQRREQELQELQQRIQQTAAEDQQNLQKQSSDKMQAIADKVRSAVKEIGDAGGYVYIMDTTSGIPYISESQSKDLTAEIKAKLGLK
ncbi:MAG: OmpH family outer membrane protein [Bacteroidaceae bacterium]|nr:OmpH family outer membrane protein [Bacteroidaceae bacterium]